MYFWVSMLRIGFEVPHLTVLPHHHWHFLCSDLWELIPFLAVEALGQQREYITHKWWKVWWGPMLPAYWWLQYPKELPAPHNSQGLHLHAVLQMPWNRALLRDSSWWRNNLQLKEFAQNGREIVSLRSNTLETLMNAVRLYWILKWQAPLGKDRHAC